MPQVESIAPETGAKSTLPEGVDSVALNQQLELVFGGGNLKLEKRMRRNAANMVAGRGIGRRSVDDYLDKHEVGKKAQELGIVAGSAIFGAGVYNFEPNKLSLATEGLFIAGALVGPAVEVTAGGLKMLETKFPKMSGLAKFVSGARSKAYLVSQMSAVAATGFMGAGIVDALTPDVVSATAGAGAGHEQAGAHFGGSPDVQDLRRQAEKQATDGALKDFFGADVQPPVVDGTDAGSQMPLPDGPNAPAGPDDLGSLPKLPEIDVQKIVDTLPKSVGVAQLPEDQQLGASHWKLAEAWSKPLSNTFGLSEPAQTFLTDAVKDLTQDQGGIRMDTVVGYDKHHIGDYLAEAVARLKDTDPAGWQVKVSQGDLERLTKIAEFLKNSK